MLRRGDSTPSTSQANAEALFLETAEYSSAMITLGFSATYNSQANCCIFGSQVHLPKHVDSGNLGYNYILYCQSTGTSHQIHVNYASL